MTNQQHPITPPPELLHECYDLAQKLLDTGFPLQFAMSHALRHAYAAGADQELEACVEWVKARKFDGDGEVWSWATSFRAARRPKPPSLKEQALKEQALKELQQLPIDPEGGITCSALETIRLALEALPND